MTYPFDPEDPFQRYDENYRVIKNGELCIRLFDKVTGNYFTICESDLPF